MNHRKVNVIDERQAGYVPAWTPSNLLGPVAGAAAFAFPSTKEGFGLAAMEALAAGTPVVVMSRSTGL